MNHKINLDFGIASTKKYKKTDKDATVPKRALACGAVKKPVQIRVFCACHIYQMYSAQACSDKHSVCVSSNIPFIT